MLSNSGRTPRELAPYLLHRAENHNGTIVAASEAVARLLLQIDRGDLFAAAPILPQWAGATAHTGETSKALGREVRVAYEQELVDALKDAQPGDVIVLTAPQLHITRTLDIARPGEFRRPITLTSAAGQISTIEFTALEGLRVLAPNWIFANLHIRGVCANHVDCQHAFHIVSGASNTIIRNCRIEDFDAHIKINGQGGKYPDNGIIEGNTLSNSAPRRTNMPVTPIDLVAASGWKIRSNLIADFIKAGGNRISYGAFAKGGGTGNRFEDNVIICEARTRAAAGQRVGLSFGGGGTAGYACRDRSCIVEQVGGVARNNLIAFCSNVGIHLNRAASTKLEHNTLLDTGGIEVRFPESSLDSIGNLVDGPIYRRDGGTIVSSIDRSNNAAWMYFGVHPVRKLFADWSTLNLRWARAAPYLDAATRQNDMDGCGIARSATPAYGAFEQFDRCARTPAHQREILN